MMDALTLLFTFWIGMYADPCLLPTVDETRIVRTWERGGLSVRYGDLEAYRSDHYATWFFYRADSPFQVPESGTLDTILTKAITGDTDTLTLAPPASCALPIPSRPRA